ncbi:MAG: hypothetical protein Q8M15_09195 [Bacteroidota bacterium]|nr:hypothetical protein [Bacteroidota bacterium]
MDWGLKSYKDIAEFASYLVTSLSLMGLFIVYRFSKKQIHFSTMEKCINDFKELDNLDSKASQKDIMKYIELVNEEFFYLENGYLQAAVAIEWIDGMIDFLPFLDKSGNIKNQRFELMVSGEVVNTYLINYPRVLNSIKLKTEIDFDKIHSSSFAERKNERDKLITQIVSNLKLSRFALLKKCALYKLRCEIKRR